MIPISTKELGWIIDGLQLDYYRRLKKAAKGGPRDFKLVKELGERQVLLQKIMRMYNEQKACDITGPETLHGEEDESASQP